MSAIPQDAARRLQLAAFAGNEPASSFIEIRPLPAVERHFVPVRDFTAAGAIVERLKARCDVYVGVAPRTRQAGTQDAIERVWTLWADCDTHEAVERLRAFRPLPSIVTRSGTEGHLHAFWSLRRPMPALWAPRANRRLALALGADKVATDAARVLRPAGSLNHKTSPPRPVECVRVELDSFTVDEVVGGLPDERDYAPPSRPVRRIRADGSSVLDGLERTVRDAPVGNRNAALYWAACRARERIDTGDLDAGEARGALHAAALTAGLSDHETTRTLSSALEAIARVA